MSVTFVLWTPILFIYYKVKRDRIIQMTKNIQKFLFSFFLSTFSAARRFETSDFLCFRVFYHWFSIICILFPLVSLASICSLTKRVVLLLTKLKNCFIREERLRNFSINNFDLLPFPSWVIQLLDYLLLNLFDCVQHSFFSIWID